MLPRTAGSLTLASSVARKFTKESYHILATLGDRTHEYQGNDSALAGASSKS